MRHMQPKIKISRLVEMLTMLYPTSFQYVVCEGGGDHQRNVDLVAICQLEDQEINVFNWKIYKKQDETFCVQCARCAEFFLLLNILAIEQKNPLSWCIRCVDLDFLMVSVFQFCEPIRQYVPHILFGFGKVKDLAWYIVLQLHHKLIFICAREPWEIHLPIQDK